MLANGRTDADSASGAGVTTRTLYKWKLKPEFSAMVEFLKEERDRQISEQAENIVNLASAREDEEKALNIQREIVGELGALTLDFVKRLREEGAEALSPRSLPQFIKSFAEAVSAMQTTNDRLIGLEALISDVEDIEAQIQEKLESVEEGDGA